MDYQCSECGQSVATIKGHSNNWVRSLARRHSDLAEAITALVPQLDSTNIPFAVPEFIDERIKMANGAAA